MGAPTLPAPATKGPTARFTLGLLLLTASLLGVEGFLAPLPRSGLVGRGAGASGAAAAPRGPHPFLAAPRSSALRRLYASVDTKEEEEEKAAIVVDEQAQKEMERLLADGTDLLGLVDHLREHKDRVRLSWEQVRGAFFHGCGTTRRYVTNPTNPISPHAAQGARLLDRMADTKTFRANLLARQEAGLVPATEKETKMDVSLCVCRALPCPTPALPCLVWCCVVSPT